MNSATKEKTFFITPGWSGFAKGRPAARHGPVARGLQRPGGQEAR